MFEPLARIESASAAVLHGRSACVPWSKCPRSTPSSVKRWIMPVSRSATNIWRDAGSNARPPSAGPELRHAVEHDIGEQVTAPVSAVDLPDRARSAIQRDRSKQAGHEGCVRRAAARTIGHAIAIGIGHNDRQTVSRARGGVDVRRVGVVERERKHLADLARGRGERLGCGTSWACGGPPMRARPITRNDGPSRSI